MSESLPPLHTQDPQTRFSNRAEDYAKYRPSYPPEAIAQILEGFDHPIVADVGAGTGISSRLLAERGAQVWAIEPNPAMREAAATRPSMTFQMGTAEQTGLADQSVDVVTCFQSFHWFEPIAALQEFHRVLKPGGRLALVWNDRNSEDDFTREHNQVIRAAADLQIYDRGDRKSSDAFAESLLFRNYQAYIFPYRQPLTWESMVGLALSASYIPKEGAAYEQMLANFEGLQRRWSGKLELAYRTHVYLADKAVADKAV
jgi:SAM-dependent methyltransferase